MSCISKTSLTENGGGTELIEKNRLILITNANITPRTINDSATVSCHGFIG